MVRCLRATAIPAALVAVSAAALLAVGCATGSTIADQQLDEPEGREVRRRADEPLPAPEYPADRENFFGIHLLLHSGDDVAQQLDWAKHLVGEGGYVKQLTDPISVGNAEPAAHVATFLEGAYERNLTPLLRITMPFADEGYWTKPPTNDGEEPASPADYSEIAAQIRGYFEALPIDPEAPLYVEVLNEVNLRFEWNNELPNPIHYGYFLMAAYDALKSVENVDIQVVSAGLSPGSPGGSVSIYNYIRVLFDRVPEAVGAFDYWGSHSYPGNVAPDYNYHNGRLDPASRSWGIDSYVLELRQIAEYTDRDVPVMITETGYDLGNRVNPGFDTISEELRTGYTEEAFLSYWSQWSEVQSVIPFLLADTGGDEWKRYAWVYSDAGSHEDGYPTRTHPVYDRIAALPKPAPESEE